jgi:hypothetical protein
VEFTAPIMFDFRRIIIPVFVTAYALVMLPSLQAQAPPPADYNPEWVETRFIFGKTEYLIGEPIYWEIEMHSQRPISEVRLRPDYAHDVYLEIVRPGLEPMRYLGTALKGMDAAQLHEIIQGDRRFFHFRVYYDSDPTAGSASRLLFRQPGEAFLRPAVRYEVNARNQLYAPGVGHLIRIVEPTGRNAEALRVISDARLIRVIHDMTAPPEMFERIETILGLYRDTVYAPHLAVALANGYYEAAVKAEPNIDEPLMRKALAAFTVLLQVQDVPYIQELAMFMIAACNYRLDRIENFISWYQFYLDTYGQRGRFAFQNHFFAREFARLKPFDAGDLWYMYP